MHTFVILIAMVSSVTLFGNGETGVLVAADPVSQDQRVRLCDDEFQYFISVLKNSPDVILDFQDYYKEGLTTDFKHSPLEMLELVIKSEYCTR